jgi:hypothetical protein
LRFALADNYRAGRIFVAGDAAHSHPPYGGYGINSGLEDVRNIGWKLAAVLEGWGDTKLLDSYDAERRLVFRSTIDDFIAKSIKSDGDFLEAYSPDRDLAAFESALKERASGAVSEVHAFEPNYEGSPIVWNADAQTSNAQTAQRHPSAKGNHRFEANAGHHLAPALLSSGQNVFEKLGAGFTLLALGAHSESVNAFRVVAKEMNVPLTIVEDCFEGEVKRYQARFVLIRPDHFVAWTSMDEQLASHLPKQILTFARGVFEN